MSTNTNPARHHKYDPWTKAEWLTELRRFTVGQTVRDYNLGLRGEVTKIDHLVHFTDQYGRTIKLDPFSLR